MYNHFKSQIFNLISQVYWPTDYSKPTLKKSLLLVFFVFLGLLYWTASAQSIQGGHAGELLTVAFQGGIAQSPGFPLYSAIARTAAQIPTINQPFTLSALSGCFGVGAILMLFLALRRWGIGDLVSLFVCFIFALSPIFWRTAGVADVFSLQTLIGAAVLWSAGRSKGVMGRESFFSGAERALILGLCLGLGLSNHFSILVFLPVVALGLFRSWRESPRRGYLLYFPFGLVLGLLPYVFLITSSDLSGESWGPVITHENLLSYVLGSGVWTTYTSFELTSISTLNNTLAYFIHLPRAFTVLLPMGMIGVFLALRTMRGTLGRSDGQLDCIALILSFILSLLLYLPMISVEPDGIGNTILEPHYLAGDLLFSFFCAFGVQYLIGDNDRIRIFLLPLAVGFLSIIAIGNIQSANWAGDTITEDYLIHSLEIVPPRSVLVGTGELQLYGFLAAQEVLARRNDVVYLDTDLMGQSWYRERIQRKIPEVSLPQAWTDDSLIETVTGLLEHRQVYLATPDDLTVLRDAFDGYPRGTLWTIVPPSGETLPPARIVWINRQLHDRFESSFRTPGEKRRDSWSELSNSFYAQSWNYLGQLYRSLGRIAEAEELERIGSPYRIRQN